MKETFAEMLGEIYEEAENKSDIDFWDPVSKLINESMEIRNKLEMTQAKLAELMDTKQSVISRFENLGRLPSYSFIAKLSQALGHKPGMTLYGDFMAIVPAKDHEFIRKQAEAKGKTTREISQELMERVIKNNKIFLPQSLTTTSSGIWDDQTKQNKMYPSYNITANPSGFNQPGRDGLAKTG